MTDEMWEVVDRDGTPVGRLTPRSDPHFDEGEYHFVVGTCVVAGDGRILVTRRAPGKSWAGRWEFPAGSALPGESPVVAARREVAEETGLELPLPEFSRMRRVRESVKLFELFVAATDEAGEIVPQPGELDDYAWVHPDAVFGATRTVDFATPWLARLDAVEDCVRAKVERVLARR